MIKKLLSATVIILTVSVFNASAQCVPDQSITVSGIYPDSATNLASATVGIAYNQVIQARVPVDTVVATPLGNLTANINNISVTSVTGLPPGLTYNCTPSSCTIPGGSNGCMLISGTPTTAGTYYLTVILTTSATVLFQNFTQVDTLNYYFINVNSPSGLSSATGFSFQMLQSSPNPAATFTDINFATPVAGDFVIRMYNMLGKEVMVRNYHGTAGINNVRLDVADKAAGIYMVTIDNGAKVLSGRLIVSK